jgi:hypothetical protein
MNDKRIYCVLAFALWAAFAMSAQAQIIWVGDVSSDIFDEANWNLTSSSVTVIDPDVTISDDAVIGPGPFTNDPVIPELSGQQRFQLDDGRTLTLNGVSLTVAGNDGVGGAPETTNGPTVDVIGGAQFDPFFVVNDVEVKIDGTSSATFGGGGNPINLSTVDLTPGAVLAFLAETPDAYRTEHLSKTFVLGTPAVEGVNVAIESDGAAGSIITVIPEPSSMVLALFGLFSVMAFCRRK